MDKSVLISLGDSRMKEVAEVLSSKSCVRILDLLGNEDLTISEISERLKMKLNTVDYNVKKLVRAGLIEKADHWWSVKGRRMVVYRVSDSRIVISPKRKVAAKFLWVLGLVGVFGLWARGLVGRVSESSESVRDFAAEAPKAAKILAVNEGVSDGGIVYASDPGFWGSLAGWEWFLFGAWSVLVLFFVYAMIVERRRG